MIPIDSWIWQHLAEHRQATEDLSQQKKLQKPRETKRGCYRNYITDNLNNKQDKSAQSYRDTAPLGRINWFSAMKTKRVNQDHYNVAVNMARGTLRSQTLFACVYLLSSKLSDGLSIL